MKFYKIIIVAASVFALVACSTSKEISYFQDLRPGESELMLAVPMEIKIQPKDKLSILVNSQDLRLTNLFNLPIVSQQVGQDSSLGTNRGLSGYTVDSNKEHGEGRSDVVIYDDTNGRVAIFEAKYSKTSDRMEMDCDRAIDQINDRMYADEYADEYETVLCYGIAFYKKRCRVKKK